MDKRLKAINLSKALFGDKAIAWMLTPNEAFGGDAPMEILSDKDEDGEQVINFLLEKLGKKEGSAF